MAERRTKARVFDLDDTLIGREVITRWGGVVNGLFTPHKDLPTIEDVRMMPINHENNDEMVKLLSKESVSLFMHATRDVYPAAIDELKRISSLEDTDIIGATGRSNKFDWVYMTEETLTRGGVKDLFSEIFYTPEGISTAVSKAHVLDMLRADYCDIEMDEDDPRTILYLAKNFPKMKFNYRVHSSTSLLVPFSELRKYPNIVPQFPLG